MTDESKIKEDVFSRALWWGVGDNLYGCGGGAHRSFGWRCSRRDGARTFREDLHFLAERGEAGANTMDH